MVKVMTTNIFKLFGTLLLVVLVSSCGKTVWEPSTATAADAYGNNALDETTANIITIKALKESSLYKPSFTTQYTTTEIKEDIYIKGVVTGNDLGGNMYSEISIQDETGAIVICISQSGLWGFLPKGQEILVALKGLYTGCYGLQPEIGMPYTSSSKSSSSYGKTYVSRMDPVIWNQHFKILGQDLKKYYTYASQEFSTSWDLYEAAGKVCTLKGVKFRLGGKKTYFDLESYDPSTASTWNTSRYFEDMPSTVFAYTSRYAKFAADTLPKGKVNVTGVVKRYNNNYELLIIDVDDVVAAE